MSDVTQLLHALDAGDPKAADQLLPLVYQELRKLAAARMAQEKPGQTLQATALVHEAWLRLAGADEQKAWNSRGHFFGAAAEAMRHILVESARRKDRLRHGGELERAALDGIEIAAPMPEDRLVQVSEALSAERPESKFLLLVISRLRGRDETTEQRSGPRCFRTQRARNSDGANAT